MNIEEEIKKLENALSGALLVPSECAFVSTEIIKICLETLKTYESWENLIKREIEKQIRADANEEYNQELKAYLRRFSVKTISDADIDYVADQLKEKQND